MTRRKLAVISVCLLLALAGAAASVLWAMMQPPDFYSAALNEQPDRFLRKQHAKQLVQRTVNMMEEIESQDRWSQEFTQQQVNGWLAEELPKQYSQWVPKGVEDPRVQLTDGTVRLGFRVQQEDWEGIVSLTLKPWVVEPNRVALQVESIRAGLVPVPLERVLAHVNAQIKEEERWRIEWRQRDGKDVAIIRLVPDDRDRPVLERIEVVEGAVRVAGRGQASFDQSRMPAPPVARRLDEAGQSARK